MHETSPHTYRKAINVYAGSDVGTIAQIAGVGADKNEGVRLGTCSLQDDMYYCGTSCEVCDYEF